MELKDFLQTNWEQAGFDQPVKIQAAVFEPITSGENIIGIAPTGSGKTLAYLLPLMNQLENGKMGQVLILTSSQELAMQVVNVAREWLVGSGMKVQSLIGGANVKRQQEALKKKPELLVGTPGRVYELIQSRKLKTQNFKTIVFDEVDQLLTGQSLQLIKNILKASDNQVQRLYFSATAQAVVEEIQQLDDEVKIIDVTKIDDSQGEVAHYFITTNQRKKVDVLRRLLNMPEFWGLIFFNQVSELGVAEEKLLFHKLPIASLASDQFKTARKDALAAFKKHQINGLLTTDVGSRGLDISGLPIVVNADFPITKESYLHRSGRVGRMGQSGMVISLIASHEESDLRKIKKQLGVDFTEVFVHGGGLVLERPEKNEKTKKKRKGQK